MPMPADTTDPPAFSLRLREATSAAHDQAESQQFIQMLMAGSLNVRALVSLLESLLPVYAELEEQMKAHASDSTVGLFDHRALDRTQRLQADLERFGSRGRMFDSSAVSAYVDAISASASSPHRLLAHHYTRYLGDLAGGQAISRLVQRHYGVSADHLTYYDFSGLGDTHHYRRTYRALLDLVPWTPTEQAEFIAECEVAFESNSRLFAELGERCGLSMGGRMPVGAVASAEARHAMVLNAPDGGTRRGRQGRRGDRGARTPA
jgi:heme oxygenase (biliverdin-producing, ferredoxin)